MVFPNLSGFVHVVPTHTLSGLLFNMTTRKEPQKRYVLN